MSLVISGKTVAAVLVSLVFLTLLSVWAQDDETASRYDFLCGSYLIIGKWPDSDTSYTGSGTISKSERRLTVKKHIRGEVIIGSGEVVEATPDKVKALRVRFDHGGARFEATYLMATDLDNYPRLTGYLYRDSGNTTRPGLEAWFIDHRP